MQFSSNPAYADAVAKVLNPIKEKELSSATLETVAIIAYKQPVTRLELEEIRGVNCDYVIQVLLKHNLIEVVGRKDAVGKPLLFGTTDEFLKRFQISSIQDLPDYEQLLDSIKVISGDGDSKGLYNEFEIPDEEVPEFLQGEQLQKIEAPLPLEEVAAAAQSDEENNAKRILRKNKGIKYVYCFSTSGCRLPRHFVKSFNCKQKSIDTDKEPSDEAVLHRSVLWLKSIKFSDNRLVLMRL